MEYDVVGAGPGGAGVDMTEDDLLPAGSVLDPQNSLFLAIFI